MCGVSHNTNKCKCKEIAFSQLTLEFVKVWTSHLKDSLYIFKDIAAIFCMSSLGEGGILPPSISEKASGKNRELLWLGIIKCWHTKWKTNQLCFKYIVRLQPANNTSYRPSTVLPCISSKEYLSALSESWEGKCIRQTSKPPTHTQRKSTMSALIMATHMLLKAHLNKHGLKCIKSHKTVFTNA